MEVYPIMKKFLAIALAALLLVCMISCSKDQAPEIDNSDDGASVGEEMVKDNFKYAVNTEGDYEIVGYVSDGAVDINITLPTSIDGRPVTGVGTDAFKAVKNLKSVVIPEGYTYIAQSAFWGCDGLTEVTLPNTVTKIDKLAFSACVNLTKVNFSNKLEIIDDYAFAYCDKLATIQLPDSLTAIGVGAFFDCDSLVSVAIPASVKSIAKGAFVECKLLVGVSFAEDDNWYCAVVDANGEFVFNAKGEIVYDAVDAATMADASLSAILLADGAQLERIVPEA